MTDALATLMTLMPPPDDPGVPVPWQEALGEIGIEFPEDYRRFVDLYGYGSIDGIFFVDIPSSEPEEPGAPIGFQGFLAQSHHVCELLAEMGELEERGVPFTVFPETGGLIAWGHSISGDNFFWRTSVDDADLWAVVIWSRSGEWWHFDGNATDLILALVRDEDERTHLSVEEREEPPSWLHYGDWTSWHSFDFGYES